MTTENGQRTKRKYTVTDKVLAANRLNLEKARAVDKKIRYRATPKRLEGNRASLIKARQSPNYKPYVRYGLRAVDLRQSALQVGETLEDYDRHTRGIVVLGLDAPEAELAASFEIAAGFGLVKGFAVGRTIFGDVARAWFKGDMQDGAAVAEMTRRYRRLCVLWDKARADAREKAA